MPTAEPTAEPTATATPATPTGRRGEFAVSDAVIFLDTLGDPVAEVAITNISEVELRSLSILLCAFDASGAQVD